MRTLLAVILVAAAVACGVDTGGTASIQEPGPGDPMTIFTHCGFYEIEYRGVLWTPESIQRGSSPEGTGFNTTAGEVVIVRDKLVFRADSGLEVTFIPAPEEPAPIPGCD